MSVWQPIETAPRDGSTFVTMNSKASQPEFEVGRYDPLPWDTFVPVGDGLYRIEKTIATEWRGFDNFHRATHWTPLPAPPGDGA